MNINTKKRLPNKALHIVVWIMSIESVTLLPSTPCYFVCPVGEFPRFLLLLLLPPPLLAFLGNHLAPVRKVNQMENDLIERDCGFPSFQTFKFEMEEKSRSCNVCVTHGAHICILNKWQQQGVQSCGQSGDTPKGFTNFDDDRFSNQLEKHKDLEIHSEASHASAYQRVQIW
ncbi:hypothetical protein CR513_39128, partial [Mucuna pruriens]